MKSFAKHLLRFQRGAFQKAAAGPLLLPLLLSSPAFSQNTEQNDSLQVTKNAAGLISAKLQKETFFMDETIVSPKDFIGGIIFAMRNENWEERYTPGPLLKGFFNSSLSAMRLWMYLRMLRLTVDKNDMEAIKNAAETVKRIFKPEIFEEEVRRLVGPLVSPYAESWLLRLALEYRSWVLEYRSWTEEDGALDLDPETLSQAADKLAERLFHRFKAFRIPHNPHWPGIAETLHFYFQERGIEKRRAQMEDIIRKTLLSRNDGSEMDKAGRDLVCRTAEELRAGVHMDFLRENNLLLPGYEEWETRSKGEDAFRIALCERAYRKMTSFSENYDSRIKDLREIIKNNESVRNLMKMKGLELLEEGSRLLTAEDIIRAAPQYHYLDFFFYIESIIALNRIFEKEEVRQFIRHNPILYLPPISYPPQEDSNYFTWMSNHWSIITAFIVLRDLYDDDPEWQMAWQSAIDDQKSEMAKKIFSIFSSQELFAVTSVIQFVKLSLLEGAPAARRRPPPPASDPAPSFGEPASGGLGASAETDSGADAAAPQNPSAGDPKNEGAPKNLSEIY